jgi:hypothetical protein
MPVQPFYGRAAVILLIAGAAAAFSFRAVYEPDFWYHLAQGRENLAGRIVRENTFSFTYPEYRQHYAPWLFDASLYATWRMAGGAGVQAIQALLLALTFGIVYRSARERAPGVAAAAVLLAGIWVVEPRAIPRPHLVSFVGFAMCGLLAERAVSTRRAAPLWWTVPLLAVWSNLHVEAVLGGMMVAIFAAAEFLRPCALSRQDAARAIGIASIALAATMINPYGVGLWQYLMENRSVTSLLQIAELQPPQVMSYRAFFLYLIVASLILGSRLRDMHLWEVTLAVAAGALGLRYIRFTPLIFIVTAPIVARQLAGWMARGLDGRAVLVTAIALAVVGARMPPGGLAANWQIGDSAIEPRAFFSERALAVARAERLTGPLFNSNNLGGYLAFKLYPDARIFQDSRFQSYPPEHFRAIFRASSFPAEWNSLVAPVDWAVLSLPRPNALSGVGEFPAPEWVSVFSDQAIEIVVRRKGRFAAVAAKYGR